MLLTFTGQRAVVEASILWYTQFRKRESSELFVLKYLCLEMVHFRNAVSLVLSSLAALKDVSEVVVGRGAACNCFSATFRKCSLKYVFSTYNFTLDVVFLFHK